MKKLLAMILALCVAVLPLCAYAAAVDEPLTQDAAVSETEEPVAVSESGDGDAPVLASVADVARFILEPSPWCEIQIGPAVLETADGAQDVYLVALRGTGFSMKRANNVVACFLSAFNLNSKYYTMVKEAVYQYIPEGAKILFAGHSLGGMIEQQLSCTEELTAKYEILNTLNVGSPYVLADASKREGTLVRFAEKTDIIPRLSPAVFVNPKQYNDMIVKEGGYLFDPDGAHNLSYMRAEQYGEYDALGVQNGGARILLDQDALIRLRT